MAMAGKAGLLHGNQKGAGERAAQASKDRVPRVGSARAIIPPRPDRVE
jgi:hypothetical protein